VGFGKSIAKEAEMKDLIEKILKYLPQYLTDFGNLFLSPKRFIAGRVTQPDDYFEKSLLFLAISVVLTIIINSGIQSSQNDLWVQLGVTSVLVILSVALGGMTVRLAWRMVGGKAPAKVFFITYSYFFSICFVFLTLADLLSIGVFKVFAPDLYLALIEARAKKLPPPELDETYIPAICLAIRLFGFLLAAIWAWVGWGAYRAENNLGRFRSMLASFIASVIALITMPIIFFIGAAVG
jgi:hypothetical protein